MTIDWNKIMKTDAGDLPAWAQGFKYTSGDLVDVEDHILDAVKYGMGVMGTSTGRLNVSQPKMRNIPSNRWQMKPVFSGPCFVFAGNRVQEFEAITPVADAYPYGTWMYSSADDWWHRCSPMAPAPKTHRWKEVLHENVPVEVRARLLLLLP